MADDLNTVLKNLVKRENLIEEISDVIGYHLITFVSLVGLALNLSSIKLLRHKSLKHQIYKYLTCKSILDSIVCLFGVGYLKNNCLLCITSYFNSYGMIFYQFYIIRILIRSALLASTISELCLTLNRIYSLSNKATCLDRVPVKCLVPLILASCILLNSISYLSVEIKETNQTGIFYSCVTNFGASYFYRMFILLMLIVEVVPTIMLIVANLVVLVKFRRRMNAKITLNIQSAELIKKSEIRFTLMILVLTGIYVCVKFFDILSTISFRYVSFFNPDISTVSKALIDLFRQLSYLLVFMQYVLNIFIYVAIDPNLLRIIKSIFYSSPSTQVILISIINN